MKHLNVLSACAISLFICFTANANSEKENVDMKVLEIKWQRLVSKGETCPRCGLTEKEVDKAVSALKKSLAPLGVEVRLAKSELSLSEFKKLQGAVFFLRSRFGARFVYRRGKCSLLPSDSYLTLYLKWHNEFLQKEAETKRKANQKMHKEVERVLMFA